MRSCSSHTHSPNRCRHGHRVHDRVWVPAALPRNIGQCHDARPGGHGERWRAGRRPRRPLTMPVLTNPRPGEAEVITHFQKARLAWVLSQKQGAGGVEKRSFWAQKDSFSGCWRPKKKHVSGNIFSIFFRLTISKYRGAIRWVSLGYFWAEMRRPGLCDQMQEILVHHAVRRWAGSRRGRGGGGVGPRGCSVAVWVGGSGGWLFVVCYRHCS